MSTASTVGIGMPRGSRRHPGPLDRRRGGEAPGRAADARRAGPVRLLMVSDARFYRESVAAAFDHLGIAAVCCAHEDVGRVVLTAVDAAVVDLPDGVTSGSLAGLRRSAPDLGVVGLMVTSAPDVILPAAALSVRAFVSADQSLSELVCAVRCAARGEAVCPPAIATHLFDAVSAGGSVPAGAALALTAREQEIASLLQRGLSNKEIAAALVIETATVKNHVHSILGKLRVHRRGEAVAVLRGDGHASAPAVP